MSKKSAKSCSKCGGYYPGDCSCGIDCDCDGCNTIREMEKNHFKGNRGWDNTYYIWLRRNNGKTVKENLELRKENG